jgi:hypothetical protein
LVTGSPVESIGSLDWGKYREGSLRGTQKKAELGTADAQQQQNPDSESDLGSAVVGANDSNS